ncbi:ArnT family glycosyltransferase [Bryocella elongata]|nr:glycosyltransferase family 39 protein [Bryocella elongata]
MTTEGRVSLVRASSLAGRIAALPTAVLFLLAYAGVALAHLTLLRLPYFWDEGGYYIPAALDFYRDGALIPVFTNAHPPLPNVVLGSLWHLTGLSIIATRLCACAFAALGLTAVFRLTQRLLGPAAALAVTLLTAVYPIWYAQSSMAHADIFAAAFTLWALAIYIPARTNDLIAPDLIAHRSTATPLLATATLSSLAALAKETAIVIPAALAAYELFHATRSHTNRSEAPRWIAALSFPLLPLVSWYAYHHAHTGFTFGNPEYLRYNATANLTASHMLYALWQRFLHLTWQRNLWVPIVFAAACLLLPETPSPLATDSRLPRRAWHIIAVLLVAQWLAFSVLGGALLTRYLLPAYPLVLIACVSVWKTRTHHWPWLAAATAAAFIAGWWLSPPFAYAPEDNLTYRDMVVVHQEAIDYVATHLPDATVLSAWPVTTDMNKPELGYVTTPLKVVAVEDFTLPTMLTAAQDPGRYDTAIIFSRHYAPPSLQRYWATHPNSRRGREFAEGADLKPREVARLLGGTIVWQDDRNGEWAAVIHFPRSYEASLR